MESSELYELYVTQELTMQEIAKLKDLSIHQLKYLCKKHSIPTRTGGRKFNEAIVGNRYGKLTVIGRSENNEKAHYDCLCDCGNKTERTFTELTRKNTQKMCMECRNKYISDLKWKGHHLISGNKWDKIKRSAVARNLEFSVTIEQSWELYESQGRKCALTDIPIYFETEDGIEDELGTASLDRIDSSLGYFIGNLQWVHKEVNYIKMDLTQERFIELCMKVADKFRSV